MNNVFDFTNGGSWQDFNVLAIYVLAGLLSLVLGNAVVGAVRKDEHPDFHQAALGTAAIAVITGVLWTDGIDLIDFLWAIGCAATVWFAKHRFYQGKKRQAVTLTNLAVFTALFGQGLTGMITKVFGWLFTAGDWHVKFTIPGIVWVSLIALVAATFLWFRFRPGRGTRAVYDYPPPSTDDPATTAPLTRAQP